MAQIVLVCQWIALLAGAVPQPAQTLAHDPAAPTRLEIQTTQPVRDFTPDLVEPELGPILRQVRRIGTPPPIERAQSLDRQALLAEPDAFRYALLFEPARLAEARQIELEVPPDGEPGDSRTVAAWSVLAVHPQTWDPVQVLSFQRPPQAGRLAAIRCLGYFYKVRQEQAAGPGPSGERSAVQVPVLVGWVELEPIAWPQAPSGWYFVAVALGAVLIVFLLAARSARRRTDWRSRRQAPPSQGWRRRRDQLRGGQQPADEPSDESGETR